MYQALKSKYIKKSMIFVIILIVAGIVAIATQAENLKVMFSKPVQLEDLDADDIEEGMLVEAEIYAIMDYYAYTTEDTTTVEKEYFIPVGEKEYMGMVASYGKMNDADDIMELTWEYMDGDESALDQVEPLHVKGTIVEITGESKQFYTEYLIEAGYTADEMEEYFLPYAIMVGDTGDTPTGGVVVVLVVGALLIFLGVMTLVRAMTGANFKKVKKYVAAAPNQEMVMQSLDRFYESTPEVSGIRVSPEYFLGTTGLNAEFCPTKDIIWVYQYVLKHSVNLIPTGKTYSIMVMTTGGERIEVLMKNKKKAQQAMEHIARTLPYIFMGYGDDIQAYYTKNRQGMIDAVAQKRAEVMGDQTQFDQNMF